VIELLIDSATTAAMYLVARSLPAPQLRRMHGTGDYSITDLAELFSISRPTVYRTLAAVETVAAQRSRR
jgi:hypothetical protein